MNTRTILILILVIFNIGLDQFSKEIVRINFSGISINTFGKVWVADIHHNLTTFRILYDEGERLTSAKSEKFQISI
jgi:hypothetical protein